MKTPLYLSCVLLLLAIAPLPYGYYQFLRIAITIVAGILAYNSFLAKQKTWFYLFIPIVILYNPILPFHLDKEIWLPINLLTFIVFLVYIFFKKDEKKSSQNSQNKI